MKPAMRDALYITAEESVVKLSQLLISKSRDHWSLLSSLTYSSAGFDWMLISTTVSSQLWTAPLSSTPLPHACHSSLREHPWMFQHWFLGGEMKSPPVDWASWGCSGRMPQTGTQRPKCTSSCARGPDIKVSDSVIYDLQLAAFPCCLHVLFFSVPLLSLFIRQFSSHVMS